MICSFFFLIYIFKRIELNLIHFRIYLIVVVTPEGKFILISE
jgi:hypothetical protein